MNQDLIKRLKEFILLVAILFVFYLVIKIFNSYRLVFFIIILSFGVLAIIWTLIAKYSLSPKSTLRVFTNNFLACSISVLSFTVLRVFNDIFASQFLIYVEFFFIFITFFFFVLASYYIYKIGSLFGFERESKNIKKILKQNRRKQIRD